jgi:hypothetical protein
VSRRAFTVEAANALVPVLNDVFREIRAHRHTIREAARKVEVLELLWGAAVKEPANTDHAEFLRHHEDMERALRGIQRAVEDGIIARGLRFPSGGIEQGLVDFPTTYRGRWVYLCWQVGEREVRFWHETDAGYAGRHELTSEHRRDMGAEDAGAVDDSGLDF